MGERVLVVPEGDEAGGGGQDADQPGSSRDYRRRHRPPPSGKRSEPKDLSYNLVEWGGPRRKRLCLPFQGDPLDFTSPQPGPRIWGRIGFYLNFLRDCKQIQILSRGTSVLIGCPFLTEAYKVLLGLDDGGVNQGSLTERKSR